MADTETAPRTHGHQKRQMHIEETMIWAFLKLRETPWIKVKVEVNPKTNPMRRDSGLRCSLREPYITSGMIA